MYCILSLCQRTVAWSAHWALAMLAGLTGNSEAVRQRLGDAQRIAEELRSPLLRAWTADEMRQIVGRLRR